MIKSMMPNNNPYCQVPNLAIAATGPLQLLEKIFLQHQVKIEAWLREQWRRHPALFYCSVDLRNAGFKLAPVDTNLFPAGFNNLNPDFMPLCVQAVQVTLDRLFPSCRGILLIPENHTRNPHYMENVASLRTILQKAGFEVRIGSLLEDLTAPRAIELPSGGSLLLEPIQREGNKVKVEGFTPCVILLNNDLSSGVPDVLHNIEQSIIPPLSLGWATRLKSVHFAHYDKVCQEFAQLIDIDPWFVNPLFRSCSDVDFMKREGEEYLLQTATELFEEIAQKYRQYNIQQAPYLVIKADSGSYGMGVLTINDPQEIVTLNRKARTRMASTKDGQKISKVIIQEGVYTNESVGENPAVAEPVVYMFGTQVVGGFYRVHKDRGATENLNSPGMHFEPLAFANPCNCPDYNANPEENLNRFYAYGVVARLALLAAMKELAVATTDVA